MVGVGLLYLGLEKKKIFSLFIAPKEETGIFVDIVYCYESERNTGQIAVLFSCIWIGGLILFYNFTFQNLVSFFPLELDA